ncbi:unnamed protein product [Caenorhabditis sp. 36 PRJEB53466]|nr:unnamed protein product [Caenorhabditis sp. 36 PRJEB53466]
MESGVLFKAATDYMSLVLRFLKERRDITDLAEEMFNSIEEIEMEASFPEQQSTGGATIIAAKVVLPSCSPESRLALIPVYHQALDMLNSYDKLPSFTWMSVRPLFHQYLDSIPNDTPGATQHLTLLIKIFDVMSRSFKVRDDFFSYRHILSAGRVITITLEIIKNVDRDVALRKLALEVLSRIVRQCPPDSAPVISILISGILGGLLRVTKGSTVNADLLENTIALFRDAIVLVFGDKAVKFDRSKLDLSTFPAEMHSLFDSRTAEWEKEAVAVINDYIRDLLGSYMIHRVNNVKRAACEMLCQVQGECSQVFGNTLHGCVLSMYTNLRYDEYECFQELAISSLTLIKDQNVIERYFYRELETISRRMPVQTRNGHGERALNVLSAVLSGLGEAVTLMCATESDTIEQLLRCIADCVVIDKKLLQITSEGVSETIEKELRKFKLLYNQSHQSVRHVCKVLVNLGKFEVIHMVHNLMKEETASRRATYHLLLAYMLSAMERNESSADEPIILMLAEYLVHDTNRACVYYLKEDENPYGQDFDNDWSTCIECLSCTNVALCMKFVGGAANRSHITINSLCTILNQTNSRTWVVAESAQFALMVLADNEKEVMINVHEMLRVYSSYILNTVSLACASSEDYHLAPLLLNAYLRYAEIDDQFEQCRIIVEKMLYALDSNEQKYTISLLQAIRTFMLALNKQYADHQPIVPPEDSEDQKYMPTPQHILTEKILLRTKHMLTSPHLPVRLTTLAILRECLVLVQYYDDALLPMIHQNWYGIMTIVKEKEPTSLTSAYELIIEMAEKSGTFVHGKVLNEFWPEVEGYLIRCLKKENDVHTADYRLVVKVIDRLPDLIAHSGITKQEADRTAFKFLNAAIEDQRTFTSFSQTQKTKIEQYFKDLMQVLPYKFEGEVVRGFGRGGKELGCPTANMDDTVVNGLPEKLAVGVYFGTATLDGKTYSMAMSIGWNPQYQNEKKTMEVHLIDYSGGDFYGRRLNGVILGFIREMKSFSSLDELKEAIAKDIEVAKRGTCEKFGKL